MFVCWYVMAVHPQHQPRSRTDADGWHNGDKQWQTCSSLANRLPDIDILRGSMTKNAAHVLRATHPPPSESQSASKPAHCVGTFLSFSFGANETTTLFFSAPLLFCLSSFSPVHALDAGCEPIAGAGPCVIEGHARIQSLHQSSNQKSINSPAWLQTGLWEVCICGC